LPNGANYAPFFFARIPKIQSFASIALTDYTDLGVEFCSALDTIPESYGDMLCSGTYCDDNYHAAQADA
jgi:hypothetical protein